MEAEIAEGKRDEHDIYSVQATNEERKHPDSIANTSVDANVHGHDEDELDRVSEQFGGMIRLVLPAKRQAFRLRIFSMIKNFIGKDLTRFSLPV